MSALRGLIVGIIGLSAMQALVSTQAATANATGAIGAASNVLSRWLDPTVALIPDLRGPGGGSVPVAPAGNPVNSGGSSGGAVMGGSRLNFWNTNPPPHGYSQIRRHAGPDGNTYRTDCSGYVSMVNGLTDSPNTAALIAGYTTSIDKSLLVAGDLLIVGPGIRSGHVVIFDHWVSPPSPESAGTYYGHDFGSGAAPRHAEHPYPYGDGRAFKPRRLVAS